MIRFCCPKCESEMEVDESFAGRPARCPTCGSGLKVPKAGDASPLAPQAPAPRRPGAHMVKIAGEQVEVVPPLETMVVVSIAFVALSVLAVVGVGLGQFVTLPWTVGMALGAVLALLGVMIGVPAYHNVRSSRGRKRGRTHALIAMLAGTGLFLGFLVGALAGFATNVWLRPTCEQNLEKIYAALRAYADQHDGAFPKSLDILVDERYLDSRSGLTCPAYHVQVGTTTYILTPDININAKDPDGQAWWSPETMVVSDGPPYEAHGDGVVRAMLLGGELKEVPLSNWDVYQKAQAQRWNDILNKIRKQNEAAAEEAAEPPAAPPAAPAAGAAKEAAP